MLWGESVTEEEMAAVEEFRRRTIQKCTPKMLEDDSLFYRFMKARDFNLKDAEDMFRKHLVFRKEYQIETIISDYKAPEVLEKYGSICFLGFDKEGGAVIYVDLGRCDIKGFINSAKRIDIIKYNLQAFERDLARMRQHSKELGLHARKVVVIVNFDEFPLAQAIYKKALDLLIVAVKIWQDNYPEVVKQMIIINGSFYFTLFYSIIKPFSSPALQKKIKVFGPDGYQEALLELIDADVLPAFIGGDRTDPDGNPNCYSFVRWGGGNIPEKYRTRKSEKILSTSPGVRKLTVTRFSKSDIRFEVSEPDSLLEWQFETKSRDIGFGVYFKDTSSSEEEEDSKPVALVPKLRIDTEMEPEIGVCKCIKPGTYIIVFDNSYSWIFPKDIFYRVRIVRPEDEETAVWT